MFVEIEQTYGDFTFSTEQNWAILSKTVFESKIIDWSMKEIIYLRHSIAQLRIVLIYLQRNLSMILNTPDLLLKKLWF